MEPGRNAQVSSLPFQHQFTTALVHFMLDVKFLLITLSDSFTGFLQIALLKLRVNPSPCFRLLNNLPTDG